MNVRKLTLLVLAVLLLAGCQLGKTPPTEQPKQPDGAYPAAPVQPEAVPYVPPEQRPAGSPSSVYPAFNDGDQIPWEKAIALMSYGEVSKITVTQSLQVTLFLKDGRTLLSQQPAEGALQLALDACGDLCKDIEVVNE